MNLLLEFTRQIGSLDEEDVLRALVNLSLEAMPEADSAWVALWQPKANALVIRSASGLAKEAEDIRQAQESLAAEVQAREELAAEIEAEAQQIQDQFDPDLLQLESLEITPRKADLSVTRLALGWLPYTLTRSGETQRAF